MFRLCVNHKTLTTLDTYPELYQEAALNIFTAIQKIASVSSGNGYAVTQEDTDFQFLTRLIMSDNYCE